MITLNEARRACDTAHDPDPYDKTKLDPRPEFCQNKDHYGRKGSSQ